MNALNHIPALAALILMSISTTTAWGQDAYEIEDESLPIYSFFRMSNAVPTNGSEDIVALGVGIGVSHVDRDKTKAGNNVGLRLIWIPDAPSNPLQENGPDVGSAWGPVVDWQLMFSPRRRISIYTHLALGFVYGKPTTGDDEDYRYRYVNEEDKTKNQVVPILEGGIGLRVLSTKLSASGIRSFVAPELGFLPGIDAPYGAINIGLL